MKVACSFRLTNTYHKCLSLSSHVVHGRTSGEVEAEGGALVTNKIVFHIIPILFGLEHVEGSALIKFLLPKRTNEKVLSIRRRTSLHAHNVNAFQRESNLWNVKKYVVC